jgi:hypothetical protein
MVNMDAVEYLCPCTESNPDSPIVQPEINGIFM